MVWRKSFGFAVICLRRQYAALSFVVIGKEHGAEDLLLDYNHSVNGIGVMLNDWI